MIKVRAYNEEFECYKAVKGEDFIYLYDNNNNVFASFCGISDFSGYSIEGGTWSSPEITQEEKLEAQITYTAMITDTLLPEGD